MIPVKKLLNFATDMLATRKVRKSFFECFDKGKTSVEKLIKERLRPEEGNDEAAKTFFLALIE